MAIAWITTKIDSQLARTFHTARWEIRSFTPIGFRSGSHLNYSDIDIIVMEAMDRSTLGFCEEICHHQIAPMLVIVGDLAHAQAALEAGADDFLVAPVDPIEALLRVRKLAQCAHVIRVGDLAVDLLAWNVNFRGRRIHLSTVEFRLLASLAKRVGQMVDQATLLQEVWTLGAEQRTPAQVKTYIGRLRRKIEPDAQNPEYIITIPGAGYRLRSQRQWESRRHEVHRSEMWLNVPS